MAEKLQENLNHTLLNNTCESDFQKIYSAFMKVDDNNINILCDIVNHKIEPHLTKHDWIKKRGKQIVDYIEDKRAEQFVKFFNDNFVVVPSDVQLHGIKKVASRKSYVVLHDESDSSI